MVAVSWGRLCGSPIANPLRALANDCPRLEQALPRLILQFPQQLDGLVVVADLAELTVQLLFALLGPLLPEAGQHFIQETAAIVLGQAAVLQLEGLFQKSRLVESCPQRVQGRRRALGLQPV